MREEERGHQGAQTSIAPEKLWPWVQFVFSFYTLKSQDGVRKKARFYRRVHGSQQVVKGSGPLFQLFLQIILPQVASEVIFGK